MHNRTCARSRLHRNYHKKGSLKRSAAPFARITLAITLLWIISIMQEIADAHMNMVTLGHYVQNETQVLVLEITEHSPATAALPRIDSFELGQGHSILVVKQSDAHLNSLILEGKFLAKRQITVTIQPGQLLAFVESTSTAELSESTPILRSQSGTRGLYLLSPEDHRGLLKNPMHMVHAVDLSLAPLPGIVTDRVPKAGAQQADFFTDDPEPAPIPQTSPIDGARLMAHIRVLSGSDPIPDALGDGKVTFIPERGSEQGRILTRSYLLQQFSRYGAQAHTWCYQSGARSGCNVVARLNRGESDRTLVLTSHLDSVRNSGADDNASGTAALLELARVMSKEEIPANMTFIAFDQEELGLLGSKELARSLKDALSTPLMGVINMDMIGYDQDNDGALHIIDCGRPDSSFLTASARQAIETWGLNLRPIEACTNRSDHASFWKVSVPAMLISENFFGGDANPCYHKECDRPESINEQTYRDTVTLVYGAAHILLRSPGFDDGTKKGPVQKSRAD
jgi:hypothetical protein